MPYFKANYNKLDNCLAHELVAGTKPSCVRCDDSYFI